MVKILAINEPLNKIWLEPTWMDKVIQIQQATEVVDI